MISRRLLVSMGALAVLTLSAAQSWGADDQASRAAAAQFDRAWDSVYSGAEKAGHAGEWMIQKTEAGMVAWRHAAQSKAGSLGRKADDVAITAAIKERLASDPSTSMHTINVGVKNGAVSLTGEVKSQEEAREATRLATETSGVNRVEARLHWPGMSNPAAPKTR